MSRPATVIEIAVAFMRGIVIAAHAEKVSAKRKIVILATGGTIAASAETQTQAGYTSG